MIALRNFLLRPCFSQTVQIENYRLLTPNSRLIFNQITCDSSQLERSLSNPSYPYNSFGIGNLVSLKEQPFEKGLDVREPFLKFYETYYSANIMKLVVLGREPLAQLEEWVIDKFSAVVNKNVNPPDFEGEPYTENELQVLPSFPSELTIPRPKLEPDL